MKTRKILALAIALAIMFAIPVLALNSAAEETEIPAEDIIFDLDNIRPMPMPTFPPIDIDTNAGFYFNPEPKYGFEEGIIKEITDDYIIVVNGEFIFHAKIDNAYAISFGKTDRRAIAAGDSVKVFYDMNMAMPAIYPALYNAEFIAVNLNEDYSVKIARFNKDLICPDNGLKLNITEDSEIILEDGAEFTGGAQELINRKLIVIYGASTRSIPAITVPEKIIVMYEKAVHPTLELTEAEKAEYLAAYAKADIAVNGEVIESPGAFMDDGGILMVPVRAVAEALGLPVVWFDDTRTVQIGINLSFAIGLDSYSFARMAPISLGAAPVIKDDRTFVPVNLFAMLSNSEYTVWYLQDGQLIIEIPVQ